MTIVIGDNNISSVYVGSKPVQKIYKGTDLIYEAYLPVGYEIFSISESLDMDNFATFTLPDLSKLKNGIRGETFTWYDGEPTVQGGTFEVTKENLELLISGQDYYSQNGDGNGLLETMDNYGNAYNIERGGKIGENVIRVRPNGHGIGKLVITAY